MLLIDHEKCNGCGQCIDSCPFGALALERESLKVLDSCKVCGLCVKACNEGALEINRKTYQKVDKSAYRDVLVYAEHFQGELHPVTFELLGKAVELAAVPGDDVSCLLIGHGILGKAKDLIAYGANTVYVYEDPALEHFKIDCYTNAFSHCLDQVKPSVVLIGATNLGRSLAPRVATRFETGLTADCTVLERRENSDLVQIRPAFGGNIMAQILTTNHRPQFATVRPKVMNALPPQKTREGKIVPMALPAKALESQVELIKIKKRPPLQSITDAEILVVAGRGVKEKKDLVLLETLASVLGGQLACTRPMVEGGMMHYTKQIGLSGRTVKPKLLIAWGVSGAVQFAAGMNGAEKIIAINTDKNAPIFQIAHEGFVGDLYEILPRLLARLGQEV